MSNCCTADGNLSSRATCPVNGIQYGRVPTRTVLHHIKFPWAWRRWAHRYYFCDDPDCDVVYFDQAGSTINREALRTTVGAKTRGEDVTVCYCFGISRANLAYVPETRAFVLEQTKKQICACEVRNPAGRCCLRDFPKSKL